MGDLTFKVIVVGEPAVGKTSIIQTYVEKESLAENGNFYYKPTIGVDFKLKTLKLDDDRYVRMQLWDIAGQERFGAMTSVYYRQALGAVVVADISQRRTFEGAARWLDDVRRKVLLGNGQPVPIAFLVNKCDLQGDLVPDEYIRLFSRKKRLEKWFKTSAKTGEGIPEAFEWIVTQILNINSKPQESHGFQLTEVDGSRKPGGAPAPAGGGGCCGGSSAAKGAATNKSRNPSSNPSRSNSKSSHSSRDSRSGRSERSRRTDSDRHHHRPSGQGRSHGESRRSTREGYSDIRF